MEMTFSKNMIVRIKDGERYVNVILLYVTKKDLKKGINAISEGLCELHPPKGRVLLDSLTSLA